MNYTKRYRVEAAVKQQFSGLPDVLFNVMDYCVDVGQNPKCIITHRDALAAIKEANQLNVADGEAKAKFDARELETVSIQANRGTTFSMDVETHAKRYFIGAKGLAVYGSHEAIDHLRGKLNSRYKQIMDLGHINKNLRANLADAQQVADKYKALTNALQDEVDRLRKLYHADSDTYRVELQTSVAYETGRELASRVCNQIGLIEHLREQLQAAKDARDLALSNPQIMPARCENLVRAAIETLQRALPVKTENCDTQGT